MTVGLQKVSTQQTSVPTFLLLGWQKGILLIREFTQSWPRPSNCYPQWQTTPFSLSVGLQFTLPPPLRGPADHSAWCHAALVACQQSLSWRINASSASRPDALIYKRRVPQPVCLCVYFSESGGVCYGERRKECETQNNKTEKNRMCKCVGERQGQREREGSRMWSFRVFIKCLQPVLNDPFAIWDQL